MIKVLTESRKVFTDKDDYEVIVSANKHTTGCTITCFDNNGNPSSYYLEKLYKDLMPQVVHLDQLNGILEVSASFSKVIKSVQKINKLSELNESANPYWFVNYDYDGDSISDYQSTVLVQAKDEKSALARAKKLVPDKEPSARFFKIREDQKLGKSTTLSKFRKTYPLSNYTILNESFIMNESYKIEGDRSYEGARYIVVSGPNASDAPFMNKLRAKGFEVSPSGYNNRCWVYCGPSDQPEFKDTRKNLTKILKSMNESIANTPDAAVKIAEEDDFKERKVDYTDPKYQKIIDYLNNNGYPGSKFLGKMGFFIPQNTSYVSILFDDIFTECSIMTTRFRLSPSGASDYMSELAQVIPVVDTINAILADATTAETKDRHVSESVEYNNNKIIENGSPNFSKPGTYLVYRNGEHQTKRGFISFADTKAGADKYAQNGRITEKFVVTISTPYVSKANSSYEAFANAYKDLVGTDPVIDPSVEKINDAWRKYDSEIAKQLADKGYDSIVYIVPQNNEVNVLGADIDKMPSINEYNESVPQALGTE